MPLAYVLTLKTSLGIVGMWISIIMGVLLTDIILISIIYRLNMNNIISNVSR